MYQQQMQQQQKQIQQQKQLQQQRLLQQQQQNQRRHPNNMQDIERSNILFNQKYINKSNQIFDSHLDSEEEDDSDDEEEYEQKEKQTPTKIYQEVPHFITISSLDRNWEINNPGKSQYNFQVKFAPSSNTIVNKNLYFNNPTIPATSSQASQGLRGDPNISGWFSIDGTFYQPYNPNEAFGIVVDYEKIVEVGQKGLALDNVFKNIVSIELVSALFPSVQRNIDYHPTLKNNSVEEFYYIMEIEELSDIINGTSKDLTNAFAILTPMIRIYDIVNSSSKSIEYKSSGMWSKIFSPTPLSSLTNLTIKIKNPVGSILENINDTLDVKFIYQYQSNPLDDRTDVLVIETLQYFSDSEYKPTDTIIFRNYNYRKTDTTPESQYFNDFINRQKGHKILSVSNDNPDKILKNRIHIARPAYLNINTGYLTEEGWYTSFKTTLEDESTINTITESNYDSGRLINVDLQNIYFFKITTKEQSMQLDSERV
jgi:hypothetical protein